MKQCNTRSPVASSIKLPLRGRGLYLHDARDQYASLSISPPYTRMCIGRKFILRRRGQRSFFAAGGGAIDLVMQLTGCSFTSAVQRLLSEAEGVLNRTHGLQFLS